jgi:hypothetical protein
MRNQDPASVGTAGVDVPPSIAGLAAERRLGELRTARTDVEPVKVAACALAVAAASVVVAAIGGATRMRPLLLLGVFGVVVALVALAVAAKTALTGRRQCYVYTNGFVCWSNRRPRVVTWSEVSSVVAQPAGSPTPVGYKVKLTDGTKVFVPVGTLRPAWRAFGDQFWLVAEQAGVQVSA